MERTIDTTTERRIESLTVNLLECYEELDLIYRLSKVLKTTLNPQKSAELILSEAMEIFEADVGWMSPRSAGSGAFEPLIKGAMPGMAERLRLAVAEKLVDPEKSHIFYSARNELDVQGDGFPDSLLTAVLRTEGAIYGTLCVGRQGPARPFTARDLKLADVLAYQAAISIESSDLQRRWLEEEQAMIRIEEEMRLARDIQTNLLPKEAPAIPGYDIACRGIPVRSVGGDYYDLIPIDEHRLAICLADVTGHGVPAALLMANLQATIRSQTLSGVSPAECARRANRLLYLSTDARRFATCFYGVLDIRSGLITYSNAGQDHPLLVRSTGERVPLVTGGLMLGVVEDPGYEEATSALETGDLLVLYSDGITDTFDGEEEPFGVEGLMAAVGRARRGTAGAILEEILSSVGAYSNGRPQSDDRTLVVIRRL